MDRPVWLLTDARMDAPASAGHPERPERREAMAAGVRDAAGAALVEASVDGSTDERIHAHGGLGSVGGNGYSVRWNLQKLVGEYARHNGHADLLRERIDGRTGE